MPAKFFSMGVSISDVEEAFLRIQHRLHVTPLLRSTSLVDTAASNCVGIPAIVDILFKCENFQHTGSFKFRGATNAVLAFLETTPNTDVVFVTHSSGNHGQALAKAAKDANQRCVIVVPSDAPTPKLAAMEDFGATIVLCEPNQAAREQTCARVMAETEASGRKAVLVLPFDDDRVIAGQGTLGLELASQLPTDVDAVVVPVGGGGLISGVSLALKAKRPGIKVFGAEPANANDAARSFAAKRVQKHTPGQPNTIADGLKTTVCDRTLSHILANVDDIILVTEDEMKRALRLTMERLKVVIEPSASVGVATVLFHPEKLRGCTKVAVILCGGNVDLLCLPKLLS